MTVFDQWPGLPDFRLDGIVAALRDALAGLEAAEANPVATAYAMALVATRACRTGLRTPPHPDPRVRPLMPGGQLDRDAVAELLHDAERFTPDGPEWPVQPSFGWPEGAGIEPCHPQYWSNEYENP